MIKRKLVTIQTIQAITPILDKEGNPAESIELVSFEDIGWICVANKGQFKTGDKCVYFEIDSFLPEREIFSFLKRGGGLRTMFTGEVGYRLKIGKFLGEVSNGLTLPIPMIEKEFNINLSEVPVGHDITELLGVIKYEREPCYSVDGDIVSDYPTHSSTSGQTRIQNTPEFFELFKDIEFEETEKFEGTSVSFHCNEGVISASGHKVTYKDNDKFTPWALAHKIGLPEAMVSQNRNVTIQGEYMGPKIQGNIENLKENDFFVYDIWDIDNTRYFSADDRLEYIRSLNIKLNHVPVVRRVKIFQECDTMEKLLKHAEGLNKAGRQREGLVFKSVKPIKGSIVSFKVISNKYLMKVKD